MICGALDPVNPRTWSSAPDLEMPSLSDGLPSPQTGNCSHPEQPVPQDHGKKIRGLGREPQVPGLKGS